MSQIEISVVVPVYNAEKFVNVAMDSLLQQTFRDFEVVCVDDASKDGSLAVLSEYTNLDSKFHVIHNEKNVGPGISRNIAIKQAKGNYILFLDADDALEKTTLEKFYLKAIETNADFIICSVCNSVTNKSEDYGLRKKYLPDQTCFTPEDISTHLFNFTVGTPNGKCVKKSFLEKNKIEYLPLARSEDFFFIYSCLLKADKIAVIKEPLYLKSFVSNPNSLEKTKHETPLIFWEGIIAFNKVFKENRAYEIFRRSLLNANVGCCVYNIDMLQRSKGLNHILVKKLFIDSGLEKEIIDLLELYGHEKEYFFVPEYQKLLNFLEPTFEECVNETVKDLVLLRKEREERKKYSIGRVDIKNFGSEESSIQTVYCSDTAASVKSPAWFQDDCGKGVVIQSTKGCLEVKIKCIGDGELKIWLRGMDYREKNGMRMPVWVEFICMCVDGKALFNNSQLVWHDEPFRHSMKVLDGQLVRIYVEWKDAQDSLSYERVTMLQQFGEMKEKIRKLEQVKFKNENDLKREHKKLEKLEKDNIDLKKENNNLMKFKSELIKIKESNGYKALNKFYKFRNLFRK